MRTCSTWCRRCSPRSQSAFAQAIPRASRSRCRCSSSSAPGSAAIGTAIPTSPARSPGARCGQTRLASLGATGPACSSWCAPRASRSTRSQLPDSFRTRGRARRFEAMPRRRGAGGAKSRRDLPPVPLLHACAHRDTPSAARSANRAAPQSAGYRNADRLIEDIDLMRERPARPPALSVSSDALLLPLRREVGDVPLLHRAPRRAREQHAYQSDAGRDVSRQDTAAPSRPRRARRNGRIGCCPSSVRRAMHSGSTRAFRRMRQKRSATFRTIARMRERDRPRSLRRDDPQHDPQRRRHLGRVSPGEGGRAVRRHGRRRTLHRCPSCRCSRPFPTCAGRPPS